MESESDLGFCTVHYYIKGFDDCGLTFGDDPLPENIKSGNNNTTLTLATRITAATSIHSLRLLFVYLSVCFCVVVCNSLFLSVTVCLSACLCLFVSVCLLPVLSTFLSVCRYLPLSLAVSRYLSISVSLSCLPMSTLSVSACLPLPAYFVCFVFVCLFVRCFCLFSGSEEVPGRSCPKRPTTLAASHQGQVTQITHIT